MSKHFCGLHGLLTKKSTMTKVKVRQDVNFMSVQQFAIDRVIRVWGL